LEAGTPRGELGPQPLDPEDHELGRPNRSDPDLDDEVPPVKIALRHRVLAAADEVGRLRR
jgi:hypothetical protein